MRQNTGPAGFPRQDDVTVSFSGGRAQFAPSAPAVPEGVTVALPSASLAPAPAAAVTGLVAKIDESPVFVDDSGGRKRLLRIVGVLLGLLSISFIAVVGVALAVPTVATSVGLGDVVPFVVPGAAAPPPPPAPPPFKPKKAPFVAPKPTPKPEPKEEKPEPVAAPTTVPPTQAPVTEAPVTQAPVTEAPVTEAPATQAPVTEAPVTQAPAPAPDPAPGPASEGQTGQGGQQGAATPPVVIANPVG